MRKFVISVTILFLLFAFKNDDSITEINGAFLRKEFRFGDMKQWSQDQDRKVVKIFRDGYWMTFFYDDRRPNRKIFDGAGGGTYHLKDGKYVEKIDFYPWDSTAVGTEISLNYSVNEKGFQQFGKMNSEKYPNYDVNEKFERIIGQEALKNKKLEGVWEMTEGTWGGENRFGAGKYKDAKMVVIFQYPKMALAYFFPKTKTFDGAGLYTYQFDGKTFTETNEAYSWDEKHVGTRNNFNIKFDGNTFTKTSLTNKGFKEVYKKIR
ncbi:MAG: hypothetical protein IPH28_01865 [Cytophagaceae bacterium]|nr:hypothetical protein [Cytophagaceae bacterium]